MSPIDNGSTESNLLYRYKMRTLLSALLFVVSWNALAQDEGNSADKKQQTTATIQISITILPEPVKPKITKEQVSDTLTVISYEW